MTDHAGTQTGAQDEFDRRQRALSRVKQNLVDAVSTQIPARVDAYARTVAISQPEVTTGLDSEGVARLRRQLADAAAGLSNRLRGSVDDIEWAKHDTGSSAINKFFFVHPTLSRISDVLTHAGYTSVSPPSMSELYDPADLTAHEAALAHALKERGMAYIKLAGARSTAATAAAQNLWDTN